MKTVQQILDENPLPPDFHDVIARRFAAPTPKPEPEPTFTRAQVDQMIASAISANREQVLEDIVEVMSPLINDLAARCHGLEERLRISEQRHTHSEGRLAKVEDRQLAGPLDRALTAHSTAH